MTVFYERMTERSRVVLDYSLREALALGHNYIGTEHILLALVREEGGLAGLILEHLGLSREQVRDAVMKTLHNGFPRFTVENVEKVYAEDPPPIALKNVKAGKRKTPVLEEGMEFRGWWL